MRTCTAQDPFGAGRLIERSAGRCPTELEESARAGAMPGCATPGSRSSRRRSLLCPARAQKSAAVRSAADAGLLPARAPLPRRRWSSSRGPSWSARGSHRVRGNSRPGRQPGAARRPRENPRPASRRRARRSRSAVGSSRAATCGGRHSCWRTPRSARLPGAMGKRTACNGGRAPSPPRRAFPSAERAVLEERWRRGAGAVAKAAALHESRQSGRGPWVARRRGAGRGAAGEAEATVALLTALHLSPLELGRNRGGGARPAVVSPGRRSAPRWNRSSGASRFAAGGGDEARRSKAGTDEKATRCSASRHDDAERRAAERLRNSCPRADPQRVRALAAGQVFGQGRRRTGVRLHRRDQQGIPAEQLDGHRAAKPLARFFSSHSANSGSTRMPWHLVDAGDQLRRECRAKPLLAARRSAGRSSAAAVSDGRRARVAPVHDDHRCARRDLVVPPGSTSYRMYPWPGSTLVRICGASSRPSACELPPRSPPGRRSLATRLP